MLKKIFIISILFFFFVISFSSFVGAASTTSWSFKVLNDPDARQVAYNLAQAQNEMSESEDPIAQFVSGLEGRIMSNIQRDIVNKMIEDGSAAGVYETNTLLVTVEDDNGDVTIYITNKETGEQTKVEYGTNDWDFDF
ncbi:type VIII secretion system (T8SS) CsgF protein [Halanaerobium saccharolyticum]|uniref:Curli production assembly/transport component CsgF n=1 Tax=Halanaerobium saccharolyticum TaxID=43595 RepID=A0A4R6LK79_9FIRM|nr:curli assembly protein CsgF [Halanaerobium saccharolyticum]TDO83341.1 type VIII secretion system (T8SS) CsgF protein [Halanaerobium saccharolyticum]